MAKELTYAQQLHDSRWYARREQILDRDNYCCQDCLCGKDRLTPHIQLQVHHKTYIDGLMAWEYPDELLITLCSKCHAKYHGHIEDNRSEREKPVFVYGVRDFHTQPIKHIREVISDFIKSIS